MAYSATQTPASKIATVYRNATTITPTDNAAIGPYMGFMVGAAGTIVIAPTGTTVTVSLTVAAGVLYPIAIQGVNATGTTATGVVGVS